MATTTITGKVQFSESSKWSTVFGLAVVGLIASLYSETPALFFAGTTVFVVFFYFLFKRNAPPVLLFSFFFQWLFFQAQLIDALLKGENVAVLDYVSYTKPVIILLGLLGVSAFFVGLFLVIRKIPGIAFEKYQEFFSRIHLSRLLWLYLSIDIGLFFVGKLIWLFPGLVQPLHVLTLFRWSLFYLLFTAVFIQNRHKRFLFLIIALDMTMGFFSFFSTFKEVIYFTFLSYWIFYFRSTTFSKATVIVILILTFYMGGIWTAIKDDYREFLNQGQEVQVVLVSRGEAYSKLWELISNVNGSEIDRGLEVLVDRLSWIGAFDGVYKYVPSKRPHEGGALWMEGITRPFMPRLFFPNKKALEDSKQLNYYSGLGVEEKNTSISLSMVAGSYIDFGKWGMCGALFLFGIFCGWVYKKAFVWGQHIIIGYALVMPTIYLFHIAEESINRIVSLIVLYFLVLWFIKKFLLPRFLRYIFNN